MPQRGASDEYPRYMFSCRNKIFHYSFDLDLHVCDMVMAMNFSPPHLYLLQGLGMLITKLRWSSVSETECWPVTIQRTNFETVIVGNRETI